MPYGQAPPYPPYGQQPYAPFAYAPVPVDNQGRPLADWWQRLLAILIDGVILGLFLGIVSRIVERGSYSVGTFDIRHWSADVIAALGSIAYFALLQGSARGQSVGQMALGIAVRDVDTGGPIDPWRAGARMVVLCPMLVLIMVPVIGLLLGTVAQIWVLICALSPLWHPRRQGFHDLIQRTVVSKVR